MKTKIKTDNNGYIRSIGVGLTDYDHEYDGDKNIKPGDPSRESEVWNWNNGNPEIQSTGTLVKPDPEDAKDILLQKAKTDWGFNRGQVRSLIKKYAIYEFIDGNNYEEAKLEVDDAESAGDITSSQAKWVKDMLDGAV